MGPGARSILDTTITNAELLALLVLPFAIYGLRRGWQEEGYTAIGLALAISGMGQGFGRFLVLLLNKVIGVFPLGVALVTGRAPEEWPELGGEVIPPDHPVTQVVVFLVMAAVCYRAGTILGRRRAVGVIGRLGGAIFGALNGFFILARVFALLHPLEETTTVRLPTLTILGLRAETLSNLVTGMFAVILVVFLLLAWLQRRRARE
ncbi:MAG: hypothetical protein ACP5SI_12745 [Chloroflexia bacterium]